MEYNNIRRSQVFTPKKYAKLLLSSAKYDSGLYGKKILENSFGDGAILVEIVQAYIDDCKKNELDEKDIARGLAQDIYGYEIDKEKYNICLNRLNELILKNGISIKVNWNLKNDDFLKAKILIKFSYIVGNPPYISYKQLNSEERHFLNNSFESCKYGRFDYCYAFVEKSIELLDEYGEMSYLIPNSIYKNVSAKYLRNIIDPYVHRIIDNYGAEVFPGVNVSTSIMCLRKDASTTIDYYDNITNNSFSVDKTQLHEKWIFAKDLSTENYNTIDFGTIYNVGSTPATLFNKAFIFEPDCEDESFFYINGFKIEKEIVKKAASPKSYAFLKKEYIIFPYKIQNKHLIRFDETAFKENFPCAFSYLESFKDKLIAKNNESGVNWFEYGRSQALINMDQEKLMMSIIITNAVKVYELSKDEIPYSGIYITSTNKEHDLAFAKQILGSDNFLKYVNNIGITSSGKSKRITPNDVKNYKIRRNEWI